MTHTGDPDDGFEDELRGALRMAATTPRPPADLLATVHRGGRRRRLAWRVRTGSAVLAAIAVSAAVPAAVIHARHDPVPPVAQGGLKDLPASDRAAWLRPTGGDLAGDADFRAKALAAWEHRPGGGSLDSLGPTLSRPRVAWAGHTQAGDAAIVLQVAQVHDDPATPGTGPMHPHLLLGGVWLDPHGRATVQADLVMGTGKPADQGIYVVLGGTRRVMVVLDKGIRLWFSPAHEFDASGRAHRHFTPVRYSGGVAVVPVPASDWLDNFVLSNTSDGSEDPSGGVVSGYSRGEEPEQPDRRLKWGDTGDITLWPVGDASRAWPSVAPGATDILDRTLTESLRVGGYLDPHGQTGNGFWYVYGTTPDGSRLVVGEHWYVGEASRIYAAVLSPTSAVSYGGVADPSKALPVAVRLPRGQGWVVARKGATLRYRVGSGAWQPAGTNAALLPANATAVEVTAPGQAAVTVPLG